MTQKSINKEIDEVKNILNFKYTEGLRLFNSFNEFKELKNDKISDAYYFLLLSESNKNILLSMLKMKDINAYNSIVKHLEFISK